MLFLKIIPIPWPESGIGLFQLNDYWFMCYFSSFFLSSEYLVNFKDFLKQFLNFDQFNHSMTIKIEKGVNF